MSYQPVPSQPFGPYSQSELFQSIKISNNDFSSTFSYNYLFDQLLLLRARHIMDSNFQIKTHNQIAIKHDMSVKEEPNLVKIEMKEEEFKLPTERSPSKNSIKQRKSQMLPFQETIYQYKDQNKNVNLSFLIREVKNIVDFMLSRVGKATQKEIEETRNHYLDNPYLIQIYDMLYMKYFNAKKNKEDIVRYIIRKAFKLITMSIVNKEKVDRKQAYLLLCKRCFQSKFDELESQDLTNEEQIIELFMPYKQKSKNRTMNSTFVFEVFSSEFFCEEYQQFLERFGQILTEDNNKKKTKLVDFIVNCMKTNSLSKLGKFNRFPWLDEWIEKV